MKKVKQVKTLSKVEKMTKEEMKKLKGGAEIKLKAGSDLAGSVQ